MESSDSSDLYAWDQALIFEMPHMQNGWQHDNGSNHTRGQGKIQQVDDEGGLSTTGLIIAILVIVFLVGLIAVIIWLKKTRGGNSDFELYNRKITSHNQEDIEVNFEDQRDKGNSKSLLKPGGQRSDYDKGCDNKRINKAFGAAKVREYEKKVDKIKKKKEIISSRDNENKYILEPCKPLTPPIEIEKDKSISVEDQDSHKNLKGYKPHRAKSPLKDNHPPKHNSSASPSSGKFPLPSKPLMNPTIKSPKPIPLPEMSIPPQSQLPWNIDKPDAEFRSNMASKDKQEEFKREVKEEVLERVEEQQRKQEQEKEEEEKDREQEEEEQEDEEKEDEEQRRRYEELLENERNKKLQEEERKSLVKQCKGLMRQIDEYSGGVDKFADIRNYPNRKLEKFIEKLEKRLKEYKCKAEIEEDSNDQNIFIINQQENSFSFKPYREINYDLEDLQIIASSKFNYFQNDKQWILPGSVHLKKSLIMLRFKLVWLCFRAFKTQ
ncbi:unnamed protein product [Moneuplotes crassus]|uniref:Uncharacterized protein n=1 Tax=Euplotes crassus TaxID=5936 RepID=A0AAD2D9Z4_EUPCR|nr:unnamed protein product [Moneuplotes crassus]